MNQQKARTVTALLLTAFMALVCASVFARFVTLNLFVERLGVRSEAAMWVIGEDAAAQIRAQDDAAANQTAAPSDGGSDAPAPADYAALYPPKAAAPNPGIIPAPDGVQRYTALNAAVRRRVSSLQGPMESYFTEDLPIADALAALKKGVRSVPGFAPVEGMGGSIVYLEEDYVAYGEDLMGDKDPYLATGLALADTCAAQGTDFLMVQHPTKWCAVDDETDDFFTFFNLNADVRLQKLQAAGVSCLDLRAAMHADGIDHHGFFFRVDGHPLPTTALWMAETLSETLRDSFGYAHDGALFDPDRYTVYTSPQQLTSDLGPADDICYYTPLFETAFTYTHPTSGTCVSGPMETSFYAPDVLAPFAYNVCRYYNDDLAFLKNEAACINEGETLLLILNSKSWYIVPYLGLEYEQIALLCTDAFTGDLNTFIEANDFSCVVYIP